MTSKTATAGSGRYISNKVLWALLGLTLVLVTPLVPYAIQAGVSPIQVPSPGADLWRDFRSGAAGVTQAQGTEAGVAISDAGESWRRFRTEQLVPYGGIVLGAMAGVFLLYFLIRGRIRIEEGRSGKLVQRCTRFEIWVHWFVAVTFVILTLSGLILLYGRWVLIPLLGPEGFGATAMASKLVHNYVGPVFLVALPLLFFTYVKDNLFNLKVDLKWFLKAGGYLGGHHPSSEKINAGQKSWFWTAVLAGVVLSVSGVVLDFPNYFQSTREFMQGAHLFHTIAAIVVISFFIVHVYLASVGVEGAFQAMTSGYVDLNWAKQHHDLWYEEIKDTAIDESGGRRDEGSSGPSTPG